jgi:hypothetical protein
MNLNICSKILLLFENIYILFNKNTVHNYKEFDIVKFAIRAHYY